MKFVNNLLEVKPEEIRHVDPTKKVQAIVKAVNPKDSSYAVVVVFEDGTSGSYTLDGRSLFGEPQRFVFKPRKVWRLKPLWQVIKEASEVRLTESRSIDTGCDISIVPKMVENFGKATVDLLRVDLSGTVVGSFYYHNSWFEEVEE